MIISASLLVLSRSLWIFGSYASFIFEQENRAKISNNLASAYVAVTDFKLNSSGFVHRASGRYLAYLKTAQHFGICGRLIGLSKIFGIGIAVGIIWALLAWISLHESLWSIPFFFTLNKLTASLLVGAGVIGIIFSIDLFLASLIAKIVYHKIFFFGRPSVAIVLCVLLAFFSWSFASGLFGATAMSGASVLSGHINLFLFSPHWILQRWGVATTHLIGGAVQIGMSNNHRFVTSSAFGIPAITGSLSFLIFILAAQCIELFGSRLVGTLSMTISAADNLWGRVIATLPILRLKQSFRIGALIVMFFAIWAALIGL